MTSQFELSNAHIFFWENYYTMRQTFFWLSIKIPFQWYIVWPIFVKKISNLKKCWRHQKSHFLWWICQKKISEHHNECLYQFSCFGHHLQYFFLIVLTTYLESTNAFQTLLCYRTTVYFDFLRSFTVCRYYDFSYTVFLYFQDFNKACVQINT